MSILTRTNAGSINAGEKTFLKGNDVKKTSLSATEIAAYTFVDSMTARADAHAGIAPLWHGWALRQAFEAGAKFAADAATCTKPEFTMSEAAARLYLDAAEVSLGEGQLGSNHDDFLRAIATQHPQLATEFSNLSSQLEK